MGSFMVRGKKNMLPPLRLELGVQVARQEEEAVVDAQREAEDDDRHRPPQEGDEELAVAQPDRRLQEPAEVVEMQDDGASAPNVARPRRHPPTICVTDGVGCLTALRSSDPLLRRASCRSCDCQHVGGNLQHD